MKSLIMYGIIIASFIHILPVAPSPLDLRLQRAVAFAHETLHPTNWLLYCCCCIGRTAQQEALTQLQEGRRLITELQRKGPLFLSVHPITVDYYIAELKSRLGHTHSS